MLRAWSCVAVFYAAVFRAGLLPSTVRADVSIEVQSHHAATQPAGGADSLSLRTAVGKDFDIQENEKGKTVSLKGSVKAMPDSKFLVKINLETRTVEAGGVITTIATQTTFEARDGQTITLSSSRQKKVDITVESDKHRLLAVIRTSVQILRGYISPPAPHSAR